MSSIMRARSGLTGRPERLEGIGGFLSRAEGCWTFDARDRMPRSSPPTAHPLTATAKNARPRRCPPAKAGSFFAPKPTLTVSARTAESGGKRALPICIAAAGPSQQRLFARRLQHVELG